MRTYSALSLSLIAPGARIVEPPQPERVSLDDPAFSVMTDLREVRAATTTPSELMSRAHAQMIQRGVRLLFVLDREGGVVGVITATDLLGEKPMRFMQSHGVTHSEIQVSDIMTPASMLEAIPFQDVAQMRVGHVVATHKAVHRQHLMVAEDNGRRVRGLFSMSQVARQLGLELQTMEVAQTFAQIEAALVR
ncbi:MAG TPA: CBS domain-containing protein [Usitatibacter sp.]|jgi:CBS domain-containing protein|nr:CBS domain-containing protein [Usitatibacter sp.]